MDMRKSTIAAVAEAEKLRKEAGADKMYLEYVFYGLLKIASYRDNPAGAEYRQDAEDLRLFLEMRMRSISSARDKLREEALNGSNGFDATAVPVGRAVEIAGSNQFTPENLAQAILETPSEAIKAACKVKTKAGAAEDAKYDPADSDATVPADPDATVPADPDGTVVDAGRLSSVDEDEERRKAEEAERKRQEEERRRREKAERERRERREREERERREREEEEERKRREEERKRKEEEERKRQEEERKKNEGNVLTRSQIEEMLRNLPAGGGNNKKPGHFSKPPKRKRRTKIGLITYRGGKGAAVIQNLLLTLILPFIIVAAVELLTGRGLVSKALAGEGTPWAIFGIRMGLVLWAYWVYRALCNAVGLWSKSFCLYLRTAGDLALIAWTVVTASIAFKWESYPGQLTDFPGILGYPGWVRYVSGILGILILCVSSALYNLLKYTDEEKRRSIKFVITEGPVPKVLFQKLTQLAIFPCAMLLGMWIQTLQPQAPDGPQVGCMLAGLFGNPIFPMQDWQVKAIWICQFIFAWNVPNYILTCLNMGAQSSWYYRGGEGLIKFVQTLYTMMFIPLLVIFLHWLFQWNPMQTWVIIVLSVYTAFSLVVSYATAKQ